MGNKARAITRIREIIQESELGVMDCECKLIRDLRDREVELLMNQIIQVLDEEALSEDLITWLRD